MKCEECGKKIGLFEVFGGMCAECNAAERDKAQEAHAFAERNKRTHAILRGQAALSDARTPQDFDKLPAEVLNDAASKILLTTTPYIPHREISKIIDVISSEVAMSMNVFKDIAMAWRDTFGGRSKTLQSELRDARKFCLLELRKEALMLRADAVIGVDLDYSEFNSANANGSMLFVVASGTAVKLAPPLG